TGPLPARDQKLKAAKRLLSPPPPPPPVRLLFSAVSAAALAQPTDERSDHESGQQKRDDHAYTDEHIGENNSGGVHDGPGARRRSASMPLYGQSSGSPRRFIRSLRK